MLYVMATPIGNLEDVSFRLKETLASVDVLLCEDTRHTRKLLNALGIASPRLEALHAHNEEKRLHFIGQLWKEEQVIGLVSDAGTPAISDPGRYVVAYAHACGIPVRTIPGPSSVIAALSVSGFPLSPFVFLGFLPRKAGARRQELIKASQKECSLVLLESGKRFPALLEDVKRLMPDRELCVCRELSKKFEEIVRKPIVQFESKELRGECVFVIGPGAPIVQKEVQAEGLKGIAQQLAQLWGISKREAYNRLLRCKDEPEKK